MDCLENVGTSMSHKPIGLPGLLQRQVFVFTFMMVFAGRRPPLWSSGQCSWLEIQGSGFDFRRYQIFWEVIGLKRGPLSLVSTIEELLGRKSSGSGLESQEYGGRDPLRWPSGTLYPQKTLTYPTSGGRSVGIVRSRTQATEYSFSFLGFEYVGDLQTSKS
jgi:hypothetical protein